MIRGCCVASKVWDGRTKKIGRPSRAGRSKRMLPVRRGYSFSPDVELVAGALLDMAGAIAVPELAGMAAVELAGGVPCMAPPAGGVAGAVEAGGILLLAGGADSCLLQAARPRMRAALSVMRVRCNFMSGSVMSSMTGLLNHGYFRFCIDCKMHDGFCS